MLTSISPLGEGARGQRWAVTATAYTAGSLLAGLALGGGLGALGGGLGALVGRLGALGGRLGALGGGRPLATSVAAGICLLAAASDLGRRLPTVRRQVNEDWLSRYRGWVYGLGFGLQLGLGLVTIVTSAATYAAFGLCLVAGGAAGGAAIGGCFGLVRALPLLLLRRATTPERLRSAAGRLEGWAGAAGRLTTAVLAGSAAALLAGTAAAVLAGSAAALPAGTAAALGGAA